MRLGEIDPSPFLGEIHPSPFFTENTPVPFCPACPYTYSAIGGHEHIRLRSPYGLSIRPTLGQCLFARTNGSGNAACSREYGWLQSSAAIAPAVCGAFFST